MAKIEEDQKNYSRYLANKSYANIQYLKSNVEIAMNGGDAQRLMVLNKALTMAVMSLIDLGDLSPEVKAFVRELIDG